MRAVTLTDVERSETRKLVILARVTVERDLRDNRDLTPATRRLLKQTRDRAITLEDRLS